MFHYSVIYNFLTEASAPYLKKLPKEDHRDWTRAQSIRSAQGLVLTSVNWRKEKIDQ